MIRINLLPYREEARKAGDKARQRAAAAAARRESALDAEMAALAAKAVVA